MTDDIGSERPPCYICGKPGYLVYNMQVVCGNCAVKLNKAKQKEDQKFMDKFKEGMMKQC